MTGPEATSGTTATDADAPRCRIFDIQRFSIHDGPGIRTTVFLEGCPLRCAWCQNPESFETGVAAALTPEAVLAEVLADRDFYEVSGGGVTFSGGEPLLHLAPALALLREAKRHGLHVCVQTSCAVPRAHLEAVLDLVDLFQVDLKHMSPARHRTLTGASNERVLENVAFLLARRSRVELRMPLVPGANDEPENLEAVGAFLAQHGVGTLHLVPYHRLYLGKYAALGRAAPLAATEPPGPEAIERVRRQLARHAVGVALP
jgi:pyruvate formate lyase activating enzyme